jgi:hypothetical protein
METNFYNLCQKIASKLRAKSKSRDEIVSKILFFSPPSLGPKQSKKDNNIVIEEYYF